MAEKVGTAGEMPRLTSRQQHRSIAEAQTPREYFKRNVTIPLLDHIIMCIEEQFSPSAKLATSVLGPARSKCSLFKKCQPQCRC